MATTTPNFTQLSSCGSILQTVLTELGLPLPPANVFVGSSDRSTILMIAFLNAAGQDLCKLHDWQWLHKEWTQIVSYPTTSYPLPPDWNGFVESTMWDNTSRLPLIGPITPQVWRMLKARLLGGNTISLQYRIIGNKMILYYPAVTSDTVMADYFSRGWLQDVTNASIYRDNVQNDTDICLFDPRIIVPLVKWRWRAAKRFDVTTERQEFNDAMEMVAGRDTPAPTLSISPRWTYPYIGYINIPDSRYGQ